MKHLRHPLVSAIGIFFLLIADLFHSGNAYMYAMGSTEPWYTNINIILLNVSVHLGLFILTIHGNKAASGLICFMVSILNLFYFWYPIGFSSWAINDLVIYIPGGIGALILGGLRYYFADVFVNEIEADELLASTMQSRDTWEKLAKNRGNEIAELGKQLEKLKVDAEKAEKIIASEGKSEEQIEKLAKKLHNERLMKETAFEMIIADRKILNNRPDNIQRNMYNWAKKLKSPNIGGNERNQLRLKMAVNGQVLRIIEEGEGVLV